MTISHFRRAGLGSVSLCLVLAGPMAHAQDARFVDWPHVTSAIPEDAAMEAKIAKMVAGMTLRERWSDWHREPFTNESRNHISVWEKLP